MWLWALRATPSATFTTRAHGTVGAQWQLLAMKSEPPQRLTALIARQHGVISRGQAQYLGLTRDQLRRRIAVTGRWQRLLPGVYLTVTGAPTDDQRDTAALLYAGPGSVLTGPAALRRHGIGWSRTDLVDVLIPAARSHLSLGYVVIHRTTVLPSRVCYQGPVQFALIARAVADTARGLTSLSQVRSVVAGAVQRRSCTLNQLTEELEIGPTRNAALLRAVIAEVSDGIRSPAEADLRQLIMKAGLPVPLFNPRLYHADVLIAIPDAWWPKAGVVAEVDSREWHLSPADWEATMARHSLLTTLGIRVLHFSPRQIRTEPRAVAGVIRVALSAAVSGPVPGIRTVPS